jgi:hypothetical protein
MLYLTGTKEFDIPLIFEKQVRSLILFGNKYDPGRAKYSDFALLR